MRRGISKGADARPQPACHLKFCSAGDRDITRGITSNVTLNSPRTFTAQFPAAGLGGPGLSEAFRVAGRVA